jgi:hypothetical protein
MLCLLGAVSVLVLLEVKKMRCTGREHVVWLGNAAKDMKLTKQRLISSLQLLILKQIKMTEYLGFAIRDNVTVQSIVLGRKNNYLFIKVWYAM